MRFIYSCKMNSPVKWQQPKRTDFHKVSLLGKTPSVHLLSKWTLFVENSIRQGRSYWNKKSVLTWSELWLFHANSPIYIHHFIEWLLFFFINFLSRSYFCSLIVSTHVIVVFLDIFIIFLRSCAFVFPVFFFWCVNYFFLFIVAVVCFHLDLSKPHTDAYVYTDAVPFQDSVVRINKIHCEHCYCCWHIIYCWFISYNHHNQLQQLICTSKWIRGDAMRGKCVFVSFSRTKTPILCDYNAINRSYSYRLFTYMLNNATHYYWRS